MLYQVAGILICKQLLTFFFKKSQNTPTTHPLANFLYYLS